MKKTTTSKKDAKNILKYQFIPDREVSELIKELYNKTVNGEQDLAMSLIDAYNLGRIHGIQEERSKKNGRT